MSDVQSHKKKQKHTGELGVHSSHVDPSARSLVVGEERAHWYLGYLFLLCGKSVLS